MVYWRSADAFHAANRRDGCDDGWYLGAGTAGAEANFSKMPGFTTPKKKKRRRVGEPPAAARNLRSRVAGSN